MLETFLVVFLGSLLGNVLGNLCRKPKVITNNYIHTNKGIPSNITRVIKEHEELINFVRLASRTLLDLANKKNR